MAEEAELSDVEHLHQAISIVERYECDTENVFKRFMKRVLPSSREGPQAADVILSTIHASKGMEFPNVLLVADKLVDLANFEFCLKADGSGVFVRFCRRSGDAFKLWYVALTRAQRHLSLPPKFILLMQVFLECIKLYRRGPLVDVSSTAGTENGSDERADTGVVKIDADREVNEQLSPEQMQLVYRDIAGPWAQQISKTMFPESHSDQHAMSLHAFLERLLQNAPEDAGVDIRAGPQTTRHLPDTCPIMIGHTTVIGTAQVLMLQEAPAARVAQVHTKEPTLPIYARTDIGPPRMPCAEPSAPAAPTTATNPAAETAAVSVVKDSCCSENKHARTASVVAPLGCDPRQSKVVFTRNDTDDEDFVDHAPRQTSSHRSYKLVNLAGAANEQKVSRKVPEVVMGRRPIKQASANSLPRINIPAADKTSMSRDHARLRFRQSKMGHQYVEIQLTKVWPPEYLSVIILRTSRESHPIVVTHEQPQRLFPGDVVVFGQHDADQTKSFIVTQCSKSKSKH